MMKWIPVGKIVSTQGMQGEVKFYYYNEVREDFLRYTSLFVVKDDVKTEIRPARVRFQKNLIYIHFEGISGVEEAAALVNKELFVREEDLVSLEDGEYYEYQLIGLDVINVRKEKIGSVESILHTGANDVLVVAGAKGLTVPLVEGFVVEIDVKKGFVCVDEEALAL
jgi:16S rRNA processing protein RimM